MKSDSDFKKGEFTMKRAQKIATCGSCKQDIIGTDECRLSKNTNGHD